MAQWEVSFAVVAEPHFVVPPANWVVDLDGSVAIIAAAGAGVPPLQCLRRERGFVVARFGDTVVLGVYFSPNRLLAEFEAFLDSIDVVVRNLPHPAIVLGDFNAKSTAWGSPATDARGEVLEEWAITAGLVVLNRGTVHTCVRERGGSIVDLTFAPPALARRVAGWRVVEGVETLSDHRYIRFDVSPQVPRAPARGVPEERSPRWALKRLDREALLEASIVQAWVQAPVRPDDIEMEAAWFQDAITNICDAAMPRARPRRAKRSVYWWSEDLAQMRRDCVAKRRQYTRFRRRRRRPPDADAREAALYEAYRAAKKSLQLGIKRAKAQAREELLATLDRDPWGTPYKMVRGKLRPWAPPLTQSLQPQLREEVVAALFPHRAEHQPPPMVPPFLAPDADEADDDVVPEVTRVELRVAVQRLQAKNTAPGPDGIPGRALCMAMPELEPRLLCLLSACVEEGRFPLRWKTGKLVLIRKEGRPADSPSAYRPIVLLDEVAKLFERVVAGRLVAHLSGVGPDLADNQFGFRQGRSTTHAIMRVRGLTEDALARGEVVLAVSLDIANAFNTLPWSCIHEALTYHRVPPYLRRIVGAYLRDRAIIYPGHQEWCRREMVCGVPQGSVLGPLLWNIGYDWALRGVLLAGAVVTCYADDTLVTARGKDFRRAAILATASVAQVVGRIQRLGLEVALAKSEAICFHGPRNKPPPGSHIVVGGVRIGVESTLKYLGLVLDSRWSFVDHFRSLAPKLRGAAGALMRILPNLGGPDTSCRRLYAGVVRSMALYGAPVWARDDLAPQIVTILRGPQRTMAIRLTRGYRTISFDAATLLAGSLPWDLEARILASLYIWREEALEQGLRPLPRELNAQRSQLRAQMVEEWRVRLARPSAGHATVVAVSPVLNEWLERRHGALSFRLTQVLTGHGCFGKYLCRIGREPTPECHQCGTSPEDTALHVLAECTAWVEQRRDLAAATQLAAGNLTLANVVCAMVRSEAAWDGVTAFCEAVMQAKEAAEREREATTDLPIRRPRYGRRRGNDLRPP